MGRSACSVKEGVNRGAWSAAEDQILINYIKIHGAGKWSSVPEKAGLKRCGKSCRLRWLNYLRPGIRRGDISTEEADLIIRLHRLLGNRWALIAGRLPGRTDNEIKNYWNTTLAKKLKDGQTSHDPLISETKKPIEDSAPGNIPHEVEIQSRKSSPEEENPILINKNVDNIFNGHIANPTTDSSFPEDNEGTLNFLMDYNVDEVLSQNVLNSNFMQVHNNSMHENNGNMLQVGGDNICASSSDCHISGNDVLFENEMKCDPIQPSLELELKRVASFLDLEDEWKGL